MKSLKQALCFLCCFLIANPFPVLAGKKGRVDPDNLERSKATIMGQKKLNQDESQDFMMVNQGLTVGDTPSPTAWDSQVYETGQQHPRTASVSGNMGWDLEVYERGHSSSSGLSSSTSQDSPAESTTDEESGDISHTKRKDGASFVVQLQNLPLAFTLRKGCEGSSASFKEKSTSESSSGTGPQVETVLDHITHSDKDAEQADTYDYVTFTPQVTDGSSATPVYQEISKDKGRQPKPSKSGLATPTLYDTASSSANTIYSSEQFGQSGLYDLAVSGDVYSSQPATSALYDTASASSTAITSEKQNTGDALYDLAASGVVYPSQPPAPALYATASSGKAKDDKGGSRRSRKTEEFGFSDSPVTAPSEEEIGFYDNNQPDGSLAEDPDIYGAATRPIHIGPVSSPMQVLSELQRSRSTASGYHVPALAPGQEYLSILATDGSSPDQTPGYHIPGVTDPDSPKSEGYLSVSPEAEELSPQLPGRTSSNSAEIYVIPVEGQEQVYVAAQAQKKQRPIRNQSLSAISEYPSPTYMAFDLNQSRIYDAKNQQVTTLNSHKYETLPTLKMGGALRLKGTVLPIQDEGTRLRTHKMIAFFKGSKGVLLFEIPLAALALLSTAPIGDAIKFLATSSPSVRSMYDLSDGAHPEALALSLFFLLPVVGGVIKAKMTRAQDDTQFEKALTSTFGILNATPPSVWEDYLTSLVPVWDSSFKKALKQLRTNLWDKRLWDHPEFTQTLINLSNKHGGFAHLNLMSILGQIAGVSKKDLKSPKNHPLVFSAQEQAFDFLMSQRHKGNLGARLAARKQLALIGEASTAETLLWSGIHVAPWAITLLFATDAVRTIVDLLQDHSAEPGQSSSGHPQTLASSTNLTLTTPEVPTVPITLTPESTTTSTSTVTSPTTTVTSPATQPPTSTSTVTSPTTTVTSPATQAPTTTSTVTSPTTTVTSPATQAPTSTSTASSPATTVTSPATQAPTSTSTVTSSTTTTPPTSPTTSTSTSTSTSTTTSVPPTTTTAGTTTTTLSPQAAAQLCLGASIMPSLFQIPGRPVDQVLDALATYPLPSSPVSFALDLTRVIPNATYTVNFITQFRNRFPQLVIEEVDLSGVYFPGTGLNEVLAALPPTVQKLNVSTPIYMDVFYTVPTFSNGATLFGPERFPNLRILDIGAYRFTGNAPRFQALITDLNAIPYLQELYCSLIASANTQPARSSDRSGLYPSFLQALGRMQNLTVLDLTQHLISNPFGSTPNPQTGLLATALGNMTQLRALYLDHNSLGNDAAGAVTLIQNLPETLEILHLRNNALGKNTTFGPLVIQAFNSKLPTLTQLQDLDVTWNYLAQDASNTEQTAFANGLPNSLTSLYAMVPSVEAPVWDSSVRTILRGRFGSLPNSDMNALCSASEVETLFTNLPISQTTLDLSRRIVLLPEVINELATRLPTASQLTELNLASNNLEVDVTSTRSETLAPAVSGLTRLENLDISNNLIRKVSFSEDRGFRWNLDNLASIPNNAGLEAWLQAVKTLPTLKILDISGTALGRPGLNSLGQGTFYANLTLLSEALATPPLTKLVLSKSFFHSYDPLIGAFAQSLSSMTRLTHLDLSGNFLGSSSSDTPPSTPFNLKPFTDGLKQVPQLEVLDLSNNRLGYWTTGFGVQNYPQHARDLAEMLPYLRNLTHFSVAYNYYLTQTTSGTLYPYGMSDVTVLLTNLTSPNLVEADFRCLIPSADYWTTHPTQFTDLTLQGPQTQCPSSVVSDLSTVLRNTSSSQQPQRRSVPQTPRWESAFEEPLVTSGASQLRPPFALEALYNVFRGGYHFLVSPFLVMPSSFEEFCKDNGFFPSLRGSVAGARPVLKAANFVECGPLQEGSPCFQAAQAKQRSLSSQVKPHTPDLEAAFLAVITVATGTKKFVTWLVTPTSEVKPIATATPKEAKETFKHTTRLEQRIREALEALNRFSPTEKSLPFYQEAMEDYSNTLARLKSLDTSSASETQATKVPLKDLRDLHSNMKELFEDLSWALETHSIERRDHQWVVDSLSQDDANPQLKITKTALTSLENRVAQMRKLLPLDDFEVYAQALKSLQETHKELSNGKSVAKKALPKLNEKISELEQALLQECQRHYIDTQGNTELTLSIERFKHAEALTKLEKIHDLLETAQQAFESLESSQRLSDESLKSYEKSLDHLFNQKEYLESLMDLSKSTSIGGFIRYLTGREQPSEAMSFLPKKGVQSLTDQLDAFTNNIRAVLQV